MAQRATSRSVELDEALSILMDEGKEEAMEKPEVKPAQKTEAQDVADAKKWGKELAKEEKETIRIKPINSKDTAAVPVGINGYFFFINKNEYVSVPKSVAEKLREADYI